MQPRRAASTPEPMSAGVAMRAALCAEIDATGPPGASEQQGGPLAADYSASVLTQHTVVRLGGGCQAAAPAQVLQRRG